MNKKKSGFWWSRHRAKQIFKRFRSLWRSGIMQTLDAVGLYALKGSSFHCINYSLGRTRAAHVQWTADRSLSSFFFALSNDWFTGSTLKTQIFAASQIHCNVIENVNLRTEISRRRSNEARWIDGVLICRHFIDFNWLRLKLVWFRFFHCCSGCNGSDEIVSTSCSCSAEWELVEVVYRLDRQRSLCIFSSSMDHGTAAARFCCDETNIDEGNASRFTASRSACLPSFVANRSDTSS